MGVPEVISYPLTQLRLFDMIYHAPFNVEILSQSIKEIVTCDKKKI